MSMWWLENLFLFFCACAFFPIGVLSEGTRAREGSHGTALLPGFRSLQPALLESSPDSPKPAIDSSSASCLDDGLKVSKKALGEGVYATVKRARDVCGNEYAMKLYEYEPSEKDAFWLYADRELLCQEKLKEALEPVGRKLLPFMVRLETTVTFDGDNVVGLFTYAKRGSLEHRVKKGRRKKHLEETKALTFTWFLQSLAGLSFVHSAGYANNDVKPSYILIDESDRALLGDFGSALEGEAKYSGTLMGVGTYAYSSPQLMDSQGTRLESPKVNDEVNFEFFEAADVWALGVTFYKVCYGNTRHPSGLLEGVQGKRRLKFSTIQDWLAELRRRESKTVDVPPLPKDSLCSRWPVSAREVIGSMLTVRAEERPSADGLMGCVGTSREEMVSCFYRDDEEACPLLLKPTKKEKAAQASLVCARKVKGVASRVKKGALRKTHQVKTNTYGMAYDLKAKVQKILRKTEEEEEEDGEGEQK